MTMTTAFACSLLLQLPVSRNIILDRLIAFQQRPERLCRYLPRPLTMQCCMIPVSCVAHCAALWV